MSGGHHAHRHGLPTLGRRGGGWVAVQIVLIGGILLSALAGRGWPGTLQPVVYAIGGSAIVGGGALLLAGGVRLGNALTPFPARRVLPRHADLGEAELSRRLRAAQR
ncbi:MAG TPA: hypothetical protein VKP14_04790 [Gaiellaceae bacterium]|nr:hypothetical protein [Gaiellaceae bacterium]